MATKTTDSKAKKTPKSKKGSEKKIKGITGDKQLDEAAQLLHMKFQDLVNYAEKKGHDTYGLSRTDLLTALGVTKIAGSKVFIRPQPSAEKLRYLRERKYPIPMNTIFPVDEFDDWMKLVEEDPFAFNGADLTNMKGPVVHTLKTEIKCVCGATVIVPKHPETGKYLEVVMCPGVETVIKRKGRPLLVRRCLGKYKVDDNEFRKYVHHDVPK